MPILKLLKKLHTVKKAEGANALQIRVLQERRLKRLLKHVLEKSEFYKRYYQKHGITIDKVDKVMLKDLPPIDKELMMEHYDEFVCDPALKKDELVKFISDPLTQGKKYKEIYHVIHTSGSTGTFGLFVYGPDDWDLLMALVATRVTKTKINPFTKTKLAFIGVTGGHYAGISLAQDAPRPFFKFLPVSTNSPTQEIHQKINEYQPDILSGYASGAYLLAQEQIIGNINIKPKRILCSADPLTLEMEETIRKAFAVDPLNFYAASESLCMAVQCDLHRGFHLFNDWHCFEIVDEKFKHVAPGDPGNLILTNLYNYSQPLIRYQMNDEIILNDKTCKCGWPFPLIKNIAGRQEEFLWFEKPDGEKEYFHPSIIVEFFVSGLERLQVIQTRKDKFVMKVKIHGDKESVLSAIHKKMNEILQEKRIDDIVSFDVEVVKEINIDPRTGKYKFVIPLKNHS